VAEHGTAQAERIVVRSLEALKLKPEDSRQMRQSDERKILIGARSRRRVTNGLPNAQRSRMGDPTRVSRYCSRQRWVKDADSLRQLNRLEKMSTIMDRFGTSPLSAFAAF
jgi:hypothetical protein